MSRRQIDQQADHGVYDNEWSDNAGPAPKLTGDLDAKHGGDQEMPIMIINTSVSPGLAR